MGLQVKWDVLLLARVSELALKPESLAHTSFRSENPKQADRTPCSLPCAVARNIG